MIIIIIITAKHQLIIFKYSKVTKFSASPSSKIHMFRNVCAIIIGTRENSWIPA